MPPNGMHLRFPCRRSARTRGVIDGIANSNRRNGDMKTLKGHIAVGLLVVLLVSQLTIPARARNQSPADRIRASGLFYYFVGRLLLNPSNGTLRWSATLRTWKVSPGLCLTERPARPPRTLHSAPTCFRHRACPPTSTWRSVSGTRGLTPFTFNPVPSGKWSNLDSFSSGQVVATFQRTTVNILTVGPVSTQIFWSILASSSDFTFNGKLTISIALSPTASPATASPAIPLSPQG